MLMLMYNQSYNTYSSLECLTTGKYNQHLYNNSKKRKPCKQSLPALQLCPSLGAEDCSCISSLHGNGIALQKVLLTEGFSYGLAELSSQLSHKILSCLSHSKRHKEVD